MDRRAHDRLRRGLAEGGEALHIARHDPARALREVEAKRNIVDECAEVINLPGGWEYDDTPDLAWLTLRNLASAHSDHPDFDPAWRP
ncbi:hypothetical protein GS532_22405 [Rhodococcus hoagii]|nr:hypothetical protein [Prescottella equi]